MIRYLAWAIRQVAWAAWDWLYDWMTDDSQSAGVLEFRQCTPLFILIFAVAFYLTAR